MKAFSITVGIVVALLAWAMIAGSPSGSPRASRALELRATPGCVPDNRTLPQPLTRSAVEGLLVGSERQVACFKFGAPASTSKHGDTEYWYYERISTDPTTGRVDTRAQVVIRDGRIDSVNF